MFGAVSKSTSPDGSPLQPAGVDGVLGIGYSWLGCHPTCVPAPLDALLRCAPTHLRAVRCLPWLLIVAASRAIRHAERVTAKAAEPEQPWDVFALCLTLPPPAPSLNTPPASAAAAGVSAGYVHATFGG